jgi:hypothetical protein
MEAACTIQSKRAASVGSGCDASRRSSVRRGAPRSRSSHAGSPRAKVSCTVTRTARPAAAVRFQSSAACTR